MKMSKSIKLKDNNETVFVDSTGVTHNQIPLSEYLSPTILFNSENGSKGENITFSDNASNYFKIDIMFGTGVNNLNCRTIYTDRIDKTTNAIPLESFWRDGYGRGVGFMSSWYKISDTGLTYDNSIRYYFYTSVDKPAIDTQNNVYIYKIVGYK